MVKKSVLCVSVLALGVTLGLSAEAGKRDGKENGYSAPRKVYVQPTIADWKDVPSSLRNAAAEGIRMQEQKDAERNKGRQQASRDSWHGYMQSLK